MTKRAVTKFINQYEGEYRDCKFIKTQMGTWVFECSVPHAPGHYWSRFITDEEADLLSIGEITLVQQVQIMHRAIDRAHNQSPVYMGDIRDRGR